MGVLAVTCTCGHEMQYPEAYFGTTQRCARCGRSVYISLSSIQNETAHAERSVAASAPGPDVFAREAPQPAVRLPRNACSRCGKDFRGDWDRHETAQGVLCHICANRASDEPERREPEPHAASQPPAPKQRMMMPETTRVLPYIVDEPKARKQKDWHKIRRDAIILAAAFGVTMLAILFLPVERMFQVREVSGVEELPRIWGVVVMVIRIVSMFAGSFLAYYVVLNKANKLPNETFVGNVLALGPLVGALTLMAMLPVPAPFGCALLTLYVCFFVYDLSFSEFIELLLFGVLANILVAALRPLLYYLIALIAL